MPPGRSDVDYDFSLGGWNLPNQGLPVFSWAILGVGIVKIVGLGSW